MYDIDLAIRVTADDKEKAWEIANALPLPEGVKMIWVDEPVKSEEL